MKVIGAATWGCSLRCLLDSLYSRSDMQYLSAILSSADTFIFSASFCTFTYCTIKPKTKNLASTNKFLSLDFVLLYFHLSKAPPGLFFHNPPPPLHFSNIYLFKHLSSTLSQDEPQALHKGNCIALFSASERTHCTLVQCNSEWMTSFQQCSAVWLLYG